MIRACLAALALALPMAANAQGAAESAALAGPSDEPRGTGDLGVVIERATGSVLVVDQSDRAALCRVEGLGDLSHASLTFSPDERFAYVFGRDGGLSKVDILTCRLENRVVQGGNAIGGAISDDGRLVAVSNYEPGGVKVFDADTLEQVADIPMESKTVGLADAPGSRFVVATWDTGEVWVLDHSADPANPQITRIEGVGANPYDALMTSDGRTYIVGLFGEKGLTTIDLWADPPQPRRILPDYGKNEPDLPVYKMPHLQGWTLAGSTYALPAVGLHQVLWADAESGEETGRTAVAGQPIFVTARPDGRELWVNFAMPDNGTVQVIDSMTHEVKETLEPGNGILHMEFTPRGREVWLSARDDNKVVIHDARTYEKLGEIEAQAPSGIFFTARAHRTGL
ncbi:MULTISPECIES: cytochrome D1 domain-containing protein [unclassified Paracoccus (in: a-proteobacteria)]|uniref:cytochrome D1 domain-containing protein n=1 Tax=unclassified Paracoccus (in: a-proteobacteria) TaxID=2688777 RepID=UPI0016016C2C|nr:MULTISPECIES: cytochrome D1 domain-containing protein [unclassified Paracoccus (in: a-proteobacteria)]MBB1491438.1 protein nirF [Paracoccus sp. MC1854]MBB1497678.1 protein nirF [Paracoccus sp. MC1862]QQO44113.1 protein nirF [Paracoccus sp. MC1862]